MFRMFILVPLVFAVTACVGIDMQNPSSFMPDGETRLAPKAYMDFCNRNPSECTIPHASDSRKTAPLVNTLYIPASEASVYTKPAQQEAKEAMPFTAAFAKTLWQAHNHTKTLFIPTVESVDYWQTLETLSEGDCEDFALTLRAALRQRFPGYEAAFLIATAYTETNSYHAVLSIETDQGTIVCDNRFPQCAPWDSFPYRWKLREVSGSHHWENLAAPTLAENTSTAQITKRR